VPWCSVAPAYRCVGAEVGNVFVTIRE